MANNRRKARHDMEPRKRLYIYMHPEGDGGAGGGGAGGGGAGGGGQGAGGGNGQGAGAQGGGQGGEGQPSAADARAFLAEYSDPDVLKSVPDDKVVPWYARVKGKVDEFGKSFPAEWRKLVAGENPEHLKTLERFQSPKALYESYAALRGKLSSGELREMTPFPEKGTPEQQTQWRTINGIPEKPEDYKPQLPQGAKLTDDDQAVIAGMAKAAHAAHMRPEHFNANVGWYLQTKNERAQALHDKNLEVQDATEETLRAEWGADYKGNIARIEGLLDMAPKGVKETVANARAADGTALLNNADFARYMVDLARQINPAGVVLPGSGGNMSQSIDEEIKGIEELMRTNRSEYNRDEKKQARLRDLYDARDRLRGGKAA
jgi:hypothetical protein